MLIIAHRANMTGPEPASENSLERTRACIAQGWSVETDIRRDPSGRFYVSHDPGDWSPDTDAAAFCAIWRESQVPIALNIKELGYEAALIRFLREQDVLHRVFLFDMELLEPHPGVSARRFRALDPDIRLGARVSDRHESIEQALTIGSADIIWLDEFDSLWVTASDVRELKTAGRTVYAVSPELHGAPTSVMRSRWQQLTEWGVDGICTDAPLELARLTPSESTMARTSVAA